jgi:hypothetical protein
MVHPRWFAFLLVLLAGIPAVTQASKSPAVDSNRIQIHFDTSEAEAVLSILDKSTAKSPLTDSDWKQLFDTEPYLRLKKREAAMHRDFTDDDFKKFVLSPELAAKATSLRHTLDAWKQADLQASARRVLTYLPSQATINAKVFPEIKPVTNSFVFDTETDPAIFLYLDPEESAPKFENTVAHELHHIGFSSISSLTREKQSNVPPQAKPAVEWMGAFGEGFAMLAAAGGPDVDPHATTSSAEHARWDHDLANFNQDLVALQQFFLDVIDQRLSPKEKIDQKAYTFFGDAQGPWYTVGYKMAVIVEKRFGRKVLIECMLDPRDLLARYNQSAKEMNERGQSKTALWSPELMNKLGMGLAEEKR